MDWHPLPRGRTYVMPADVKHGPSSAGGREAELSNHGLEYFRMLIKIQIYKVAERRPQLQAWVYVSLVLL